MKSITNNLLSAALVAGTLTYSSQGLAHLENPTINDQEVVAQSVQKHSIETPYVDYRNPQIPLTTADLNNGTGSLLIDTSEKQPNWVVMIRNEQVLGFGNPEWMKDELLNDEAFTRHFDSPDKASEIASTAAFHMDDFQNQLMAAKVSAPYQKEKQQFPEGMDEHSYHEKANSYANLDVFTLNEEFFGFFDELLVTIAPESYRDTILSYSEAFATIHEIEHTNERNAQFQKAAYYGEYQGDVFSDVEYSLRTEIESDLTPLALIYKDMLQKKHSPDVLSAFGDTIATWRIKDTNEASVSLFRSGTAAKHPHESIHLSDNGYVFHDPNQKLNQLQRATHVSDIPIHALTELAKQNPSVFKSLNFIQARELSAQMTEDFLDTPEMKQLVRSNRLSTGGHFTRTERESIATELARQTAQKNEWDFVGHVSYPDFEAHTDGPTALALEQAGATRILSQAPKEMPLLAATFWQIPNASPSLEHALIRSYPYDGKPAELTVQIPPNSFGLLETQELYNNVNDVFLKDAFEHGENAYITLQLNENNAQEAIGALDETLQKHGIISQPLMIEQATVQRMPEVALYEAIHQQQGEPLLPSLNVIANNAPKKGPTDDPEPSAQLTRGR